MRGVALALGGLLLIGGAVIVVVADQQRADALKRVQVAVENAEERLDAARDVNYDLAEQLTALRSKIAEQESELNDTSGFLQ